MSNLYRARSLLYRRQILQVNTRWKTSIFQKLFVKIFRIFWQKFAIFEFFSLIVAQILMKVYRNFADNFEMLKFSEFFEFSNEKFLF